ncbi:patatin-like protein 4 [Cajanus cajan]|uniref:patatin-like protein 4 n=1 Tax=Cajanus cajan TaxID=3821 RepID=UPI00098DA669|nr:patatin-like protein 4 [Cajanus cajan]
MRHLDQLMAPLLLFALVFASQLMAGFNTPLPPPFYGNHISILSIDGGGIRGIIPAVVLDYLDKALKAKDPTTPLAHYFDVISGTSTGGIMTAMLAAPNSSHSNHPLFTPAEVVQFYKEYGPKIFEDSFWGRCPKYSGNFLREKTWELLKETRLSQTLTNVVIPTFDQKKLKPVIFSNYKLKKETHLNAKLADICLGTSAAPTYLPHHEFTNEGVEFSLIDGAVAANNPAMVAVSEVLQHSEQKEILMLSLGTGTTKGDKKLSGIIEGPCKFWWLITNTGLISDAIYDTDMISYYLATVFPGILPLNNFLRIQEYNLDPSMEAMDNVDIINMENLEKVGQNLLHQNVMRMKADITDEINYTNAQALDSLAEILYKERQFRLRKKSMEKEGSPFIETV